MKTKIICTIGPASNTKESLIKLIANGMNVARVNASHGTKEDIIGAIEFVKSVRNSLHTPLAIMLDTKGPDIRIGSFENGAVELKKGDAFMLFNKEVSGNQSGVSITHKDLYLLVSKGQEMLLNDGLIKLEVREIRGKDIICEVIEGGKLTNKKSLYVPGVDLKLPFLSSADKEDLIIAIKTDCDYIASSFTNSARDVLEMKDFIKKNGGNLPIIAKIESKQGVENIDEILEVVNGIMVARGDLGVEYPIEKIPTLQKMLIKKARDAGKLVITATEMLESMISKPRPTRAETTDIANAIYDGTGAIMLSAESAVGAYPDKAVYFMKKIAEEAEQNLVRSGKNVKVINQKQAYSHTVADAAINTKSKAIFAYTLKGRTAIRTAQYFPPCPIYAFAKSLKTFHTLALVDSVVPLYEPNPLGITDMINQANDFAKDNHIVNDGELIVITANIKETDSDLVIIHPVN
ncbi:MAG: pyruvate kinase [Christensenellaceae bacterium]|jgi:pyruvate kinase|nr:pyruvate kinase [Christensenellaceae bacterium]